MVLSICYVLVGTMLPNTDCHLFKKPINNKIFVEFNLYKPKSPWHWKCICLKTLAGWLIIIINFMLFWPLKVLKYEYIAYFVSMSASFSVSLSIFEFMIHSVRLCPFLLGRLVIRARVLSLWLPNIESSCLDWTTQKKSKLFKTKNRNGSSITGTIVSSIHN